MASYVLTRRMLPLLMRTPAVCLLRRASPAFLSSSSHRFLSASPMAAAEQRNVGEWFRGVFGRPRESSEDDASEADRAAEAVAAAQESASSSSEVYDDDSEDGDDDDDAVDLSSEPRTRVKGGCTVCAYADEIDYKNVRLLSQFVSPNTGRILPRRITGVCAAKQRKLAKSIKRSRQFGKLPYPQPSQFQIVCRTASGYTFPPPTLVPHFLHHNLCSGLMPYLSRLESKHELPIVTRHLMRDN